MPSPQVADCAKTWSRTLARYRTPRPGRSAFELAATAIPFLVFWLLCWMAVHFGLWWGLVLTIPAAMFLLRLFIIQHDCGHGSFFAHRRIDDWTGRILGVLTLTPYDYWRQAHAVHHAAAGNLEERGMGDILTMTVDEYAAASLRGRLLYRLYRHPVVMFGLGPAWIFLFKQRLPFGLMKSGAGPWISTMATNAFIAALSGLLIWQVGLATFLLIQLPIVILAGTIGVWLFYVQHQFEDTHWSGGAEWTFHHSALHGSSFYDLPRVLRWLTANIGVHHVHHLSSRIPGYRLSEVLDDYPELARIGRITIADSLSSVRLALWDSSSGRLVSFKEARELIRRREATA